MKKSILLVALMALTMGASAQWLDFKNNANRYEIGFVLGEAGINTEFHDFGFGGSVSAWGVYVDFLKAGPKYRYDNHVADMTNPAAMVPDSTAWSLSVGYQIPILPWLRIMPIVGHSHNTSGYTDYSTVNIETNDSESGTSSQMYHDYIRQKGHGTFNYGGGIVVSPFSWLSLYGVYTVHTIYGGISINLGGIDAALE